MLAIQYNTIQYNTIQLWHLYTKLYKLEYSHMKHCNNPNLGGDLCKFTFFHFPHSGLYLLNGFDFVF